MSLTRELAHDAAAVASDLREEDRRQIEFLVLDYLACLRGAARLPWVTRIHKWCGNYNGSGTARVADADLWLPPQLAAFANGAATHGFEVDDTHDASVSHPGAVVISAALACVGECPTDGRTLLSAIAAGYQAMTRIAMAANAAEVMARGFHPTSVFGVFGAATAATIIRGRATADDLVSAWGHALSLVGGVMQFSEEPIGTDVKRLHAGHAARSGILAAELSSAGLDAPEASIDGRYGVISMYGTGEAVPRSSCTHDRAAIHEVSFKPHACCRLFHSSIDALTSIQAEHPESRIARIKVGGPRIIAQQHMMARPQSPMAAQYSLPFVLGAVAADGVARFDAFEPSKLQDPEYLRYADMVQFELDAEIEDHYPKQFGSRLMVSFEDGTTDDRLVFDSHGTPNNPLTRENIIDKGIDLSEYAGRGRRDFRALDQVVRALGDADDVAPLVSTMLVGC